MPSVASPVVAWSIPKSMQFIAAFISSICSRTTLIFPLLLWKLNGQVMPFNFVGHYCMCRNDALWSLVFAVGRSLSLSLSLSMVIFRRPSCLLGSFSLIIPNNGKLARSNVRTVVSRVKKQIKATSICNLSKPASSIHESLFIIRALSLIFPPIACLGAFPGPYLSWKLRSWN